LGGDSDFIWNKTTNTLTIGTVAGIVSTVRTSDVTSGDSPSIAIKTGNTTAGSGTSGNVTISTGSAFGNVRGGTIYLSPGEGGQTSIGSGAGGSHTSKGGDIDIFAGGGRDTGAGGTGGIIEIQAGAGHGAGNFGGDVLLEAGSGSGGATSGSILLSDSMGNFRLAINDTETTFNSPASNEIISLREAPATGASTGTFSTANKPGSNAGIVKWLQVYQGGSLLGHIPIVGN
jgi:hypothetical protein